MRRKSRVELLEPIPPSLSTNTFSALTPTPSRLTSDPSSSVSSPAGGTGSFWHAATSTPQNKSNNAFFIVNKEFNVTARTCPRARMHNLIMAGLLTSPGLKPSQRALQRASPMANRQRPLRMTQLRAQSRIHTVFPIKLAGRKSPPGTEHHNLTQMYEKYGNYTSVSSLL